MDQQTPVSCAYLCAYMYLQIQDETVQFGSFFFFIKYEPVREKTNNLSSDQVQHKPGCTVAEDG